MFFESKRDASEYKNRSQWSRDNERVIETSKIIWDEDGTKFMRVMGYTTQMKTGMGGTMVCPDFSWITPNIWH